MNCDTRSGDYSVSSGSTMTYETLPVSSWTAEVQALEATAVAIVKRV